MFKKFFLHIRPEEYLAFSVLVVVMGINMFAYGDSVTFGEAVRSMVNYFTFGDPVYGKFFLVVYLIAISQFYIGVYSLLVDSLRSHAVSLKDRAEELLEKLLSPIRLVLPIALVAGPMYQLLGHISFVFRDSSYDVLLSNIDLSLFGRLLFIDIPTYLNSELASRIFTYAYVSLTYAIPLFLLILLLLRKLKLLRLAITTFIFSFVFAYPFYYMLPAQGPSYSIITNVRNIPLPDRIEVYKDTYNSAAHTLHTTNMILEILVDTRRDNSSPVSSFPSMHALWAMIIVYYLFRVQKYTFLFTVPWVIMMLTGGIYLSQHYLIDYFASIPLVFLSIFLAHKLLDNIAEN